MTTHGEFKRRRGMAAPRPFPTACRTFVATLACLLGLFINISSLGAQPPDADRRALGVIFDDRHVEDSALFIHRLAADMPADERYGFLARWVLPGPDHATFRLALDFTPTHPAPAVAIAGAEEPPISEGRTRVQTGGRLVSPALDLVEAAASLGRLETLGSHIEQREIHGELQERSRLAMLGLVHLAAKDFDRALIYFEDLFRRVAAKSYAEFAGRWPETLAVHACMQHPETREAATGTLYRMLQSQVRAGVAHGPASWNQWVTATAGRLTLSNAASNTQDGHADLSVLGADSDGPANWSPVSRTTAWSRGVGLPCAAWQVSPGRVDNLASHTEDYLFYHVPLRGNFEVECDVTSFGWRDMHLMVAGTYVAPIYDHVSYGLGTFGVARPPGVIKPRLSECDEWIRYRAVVRDGACSTYFNGRLVHTEPLAEEHDPWVAIRSHSYADGAARNVRITGSPIIPHQVRLSAIGNLVGWNAYYDEPIEGDQAYWRQRSDRVPGGEIIGQREPWLAGQYVERVLHYGRPMLEDGTIEYDFYYRDGESHVHPALDRRAFILDPDGVRIHWMTDGIHERTELSPQNLADVPEDRRGPSPLPLREDDWNRLRLQLTGDVLELFLNGQLVYDTLVEPTNQRTFGLFHWADQTEAHVRNIVWAGDWPKELPPVEEQAMAGKEIRGLDQRIPELTASFEHDFIRDGLSLNRFRVHSPPKALVVLTVNGLRVTVNAENEYRAGWIAPKLRVHGDFDLRVEFEALGLSAAEHASCGIYLMAITEDPATTHAGIYRGLLRKPNTRDRRIIQAEFNRRRSGVSRHIWPGSTAEEATSGTLRLARRGDKMYCLFAESDSPNFRLVHTESVTTEPTLLDGVRLVAAVSSSVDRPSETAVVWKRMSVRAEKITDASVPGPERAVDQSDE